MSDKIEINLSTKRGMEIISLLHGQEATKILELETRIRDRLDEHGNPITPSEVNRHKLLPKSYQKNTNILSRLLAQAPYHKS